MIYFNFMSFIALITITKLCLDMCFTLCYEYTGEIYPTKLRATGIGMASSVSRIGGIIMPWIGIYLSKTGVFLPYLIFGSTSLAAGLLTFFLPFDTRGVELDII